MALATSVIAGAQVAPGAVADPKTSREPLSFCRCMAEDGGAQLAVCCIVEVVGPVQLRTIVASNDRGSKLSERLLTFDVKPLTGRGLDTSKTYHAFASADWFVPVKGAVKRYLLLGWTGTTSGRVSIETIDHYGHSEPTHPLSVESGPCSVFAYSLVPTRQEATRISDSPLHTAYVNQADLAVRDAYPEALRQVTNGLAQLSPTRGLHRRGTPTTYDWAVATLSPELARSKLATPLEQLRIGGLMAAWDRPNLALKYLKSLPALMKQLSIFDPLPRAPLVSKHPLPTPSEDDLQFIYTLNLLTGVDPDQVFEIVLGCPNLLRLLLDSRLGKPSLENQQKLLNYLDDPNVGLRERAFCQFARWYNEDDKVVYAHFSHTEQTIVIDHESELRSYWLKKIGPPVRP